MSFRRFILAAVGLCTVTSCSRTPGSVEGPAPITGNAPVVLYYSPAGAQPAQVLRGNSSPRYPDALRLSRHEGEVLAQFVIDTTGSILPGSLRIVRATDTLFAAAIRDAAPSFRFAPATLNGRKIRQLVEQPVYFDMVDGTARRTRAPARRAVATSDPAVRTPMVLGPIVITAVAR